MRYEVRVLVAKDRWTTFAVTDERFRAQFIKDSLISERVPKADRFKADEVRITEVTE